MNDLLSKIKQLRTKNVSKSYFIPEAAFLEVMTDGQVKTAIHESNVQPHQRGEIAQQVCRRGRKILGILILANHVSLIQRFIEADQLEDARLPFTEETLTETIRLSEEQATDFDKEQWMFTAPTFERGTINRRLVKGSVLPFTEEKQIGRGGFGNVYEVVLHPKHQTTKDAFPQRFARKELSKEQSHDVELQNLAVLNSLKHPNIVELLSSYTYDDVRYNLLFPLVDGSLKDFISQDRQIMSDDTIIIALAGLSSAVRNLHDFFDNNLDLALIGCHHDLQPKNILVSKPAFILADFGLSKLKPSTEDSETPFRDRMDDYVAPECEDWEKNYEPGPVHRSSDIWSFGCILAEIVTYVSKGCIGVQKFRDARKFKRPGNTHFSFHQGPKQASDGVTKWLLDLEKTSSAGFVLLIQLVRRILTLDPFVRPKAGDVERFIRFAALHRLATRIDDQFQSLRAKDSQNLDPFLEMIRFQSWKYAARLANEKDETDVETKSNHNVLDQFDKVVDTISRLERDLDSRLAREKTELHLDTSQLTKVIDELNLFLNEEQNELSRRHFKVSILEDHDKIYEIIKDGSNDIPLSHEIRARINIQNMTQLLEQGLYSRPSTLLLEPDQVGRLEPFGKTEHHLGTQMNDNESHQVWVEWREYAHGTDQTNMDRIFDRTSKLAQLLSLKKPKAMRALNCTGFTHSPERQALGLIFDFPMASEARPTLRPVKLSDLISETTGDYYLPDLDDRFELATTLADALFEFHSMGWLHKSLTADNIVFFKREENPMTQIDLAPWLVGFNHSKPDDPFGFTSGLSNSASKLYHHPIYLDNKPGFRREFDYYSLGIVLLEIGYWKSFGGMTKKWTGSYEDRRKRLLTGRVPNLRKEMGRGYSEAVRYCIEAASSDTSSKGNSKEALLKFVQHVVTPLRGLHCRVKA